MQVSAMPLDSVSISLARLEAELGCLGFVVRAVSRHEDRGNTESRQNLGEAWRNLPYGLSVALVARWATLVQVSFEAS